MPDVVRGTAAPSPQRLSMARIARPQVLLPIAVVVLMVGVLFGPAQQPSFDRSGPLSTTDASASGARGFYETAQRLKWPVSRRTTAWPAVLDTSSIYAILDPRQPLTASETHSLLDAVRKGAGLLVVLAANSTLASVTGAGSASSPLNDSLGFRPDTGFAAITRSWTACPKLDPGDPVQMWFGNPFLFSLSAMPSPRWNPADTVVFVAVRTNHNAPGGLRGGQRYGPKQLAPAAVGFPLGAGRVVVLSDDDLLRNDVIRVCRWGFGVNAIQELLWLSHDRRPPVVFDEYHQKSVGGEDTWGATGEFLARTPLGHTVLQATLAGLILLAVFGIRAVVPRAPRRIERRSSLEHVEALARAYAQARATRVATRRLLRGLRRRHAHGVWRTATDERFLEAVTTRYPATAADARTLLDATGRALTPAELLAVGQAVNHIDRTLDR
jgi:hypothetical protein